MFEMYVTEIYCSSKNCNVRESQVRTKDFGDNREPKQWHCPACGSKAKVHWRRTAREHEVEELKVAVVRVNLALLLRESGADAVPMSYLMLDELPASWQCVHPPIDQTERPIA